MIQITWASVYDDPVYGEHNIAIIENKILLAPISENVNYDFITPSKPLFIAKVIAKIDNIDVSQPAENITEAVKNAILINPTGVTFKLLVQESDGLLYDTGIRL